MPVTSLTRRARIWAAAGLAAALSGCATLPITDRLDSRLAGGEYAAGLADLEKAKAQYQGPNSLLYYLDQGSLAQRAGDFALSNQALEQAELLIEQLAPVSISEAAASLLVNDTTLSYSGEDFEQVMVNVMKALNYLYLGDFSGAQVEARKVNNRLLALSDRYGKEAVYKEDAFARYLAAFAYEAAGEYDDAYIDYRKAYQLYREYAAQFGAAEPEPLKADLLRLSRWLGFADDYEAWRQAFGAEGAESTRRPVPRSEVLLVLYDGLMFRKVTRFTAVEIRDPDDHPYLLKVAFPDFKPRHPALESAELLQDGAPPVPAFLAEPLAGIAVKNLAQRLGLISAKAIARATAKYIAAYQLRKAAGKQDEGAGLLVGLAANIYTWATEQADTRSWRTLPQRFWLFRVPVPAGDHTLTLVLHPYGGGEPVPISVPVTLKEGEKKTIPVYVPR